jgi:predicted transcriptional regulator
VTLTGEVEPRVKETFEAIEKAGEATTTALKAKLRGTSLQAVNNWLSALVTAKVVVREQLAKGSGRPYVYRSKTPELMSAAM